MINKETILSVYKEKQTLLEYLTAIEKALDKAVLVSADIVDEGSNKCHFVFTFEDDTKVITPTIEFIKPVKGATIRNGVLYLTLADGTEVSAGSITASFGASTFNGDVLVDGNLQVNGFIKQNTWEFETPDGLGLTLTSKATTAGFSIFYQYARKSNGKLSIVIAVAQTHPSDIFQDMLFSGSLSIPESIGSKLIPSKGQLLAIDNKNSIAISDTGAPQEWKPSTAICTCIVTKNSNTSINFYAEASTIANAANNYIWRFEFNFILSKELNQ